MLIYNYCLLSIDEMTLGTFCNIESVIFVCKPNLFTCLKIIKLVKFHLGLTYLILYRFLQHMIRLLHYTAFQIDELNC